MHKINHLTHFPWTFCVEYHIHSSYSDNMVEGMHELLRRVVQPMHVDSCMVSATQNILHLLSFHAKHTLQLMQ